MYNSNGFIAMKKNIALVCLDRTMARTTSQLLADELGLRFFDMRELFEFDHKPTTFKQIVTEYGSKYYRDKEESLVGYAQDFENVLYNIDSDCFYKKDMLKKLKKNYLIIYLHINNTLIYNILQKEDYCCYKEKLMYTLSKGKIAKREENIRAVADIEINVSKFSSFKASSEILRAIKKFYGIN